MRTRLKMAYRGETITVELDRAGARRRYEVFQDGVDVGVVWWSRFGPPLSAATWAGTSAFAPDRLIRLPTRAMVIEKLLDIARTAGELPGSA